MESVELMTVQIADVDPYETYDKCPNCEGTEMLGIWSGALSDWTQCMGCQVYYNPQVQFEIKEDEKEVDEEA